MTVTKLSFARSCTLLRVCSMSHPFAQGLHHSTFHISQLFRIQTLRLISFIFIVTIVKLGLSPLPSKARKVEAPLLLERIIPSLLVFDYCRVWDVTCWVEVQQVVSRVCVNVPNPCVEPANIT